MKSASGRIPLHEACIGGHTDVVGLLLDHMSSVDIADRNKQTAVHHAAYNGEGKCLRLLAIKGEHFFLDTSVRVTLFFQMKGSLCF